MTPRTSACTPFRRRQRLHAPLALALLAAWACTATSSLPGTALGNFSVVGTLGTNTCGSGVGAANPWDFTAELSKDGSTLYMAETNGSGEVSGALSSTSATLTSAVTSNVDGSDAGSGPCNLTESTSFAVTLDSVSAPKSFTGTVSYVTTVAMGVSSTSDCTDQLSSSGGKYSTLPCTVTYSLAATKQ